VTNPFAEFFLATKPLILNSAADLRAEIARIRADPELAAREKREFVAAVIAMASIP
jgi:hypothetical protein